MSDDTSAQDVWVLHETVAEHVGWRVDHKIVAARVASQQGRAPHHIGYFNRGVCEFTVDQLASPALRAVPGAFEDRRDLYRDTEAQLAFVMAQEDQALTDAQTGSLIRLVLEAEQGGLLAYQVFSGEYVGGIVFWSGDDGSGSNSGDGKAGRDRLRVADMAVAELVVLLRDRSGLPSQNPGGWSTTSWRSGIDALDAAPGEIPVTGEEARLHVADRSGGTLTELTGLTELCRSTLDPEGISYLAHIHRGELAFALDCFDHPAAARRFGGFPARRRREFYGHLSARLESLSTRFAQLARQAVRGRLIRIVLDVEQGAIYCYRLAAGEFLVGITLNQASVSQSDDQMSWLALNAAKSIEAG